MCRKFRKCFKQLSEFYERSSYHFSNIFPEFHGKFSGESAHLKGSCTYCTQYSRVGSTRKFISGAGFCPSALCGTYAGSGEQDVEGDLTHAFSVVSAFKFFVSDEYFPQFFPRVTGCFKGPCPIHRTSSHQTSHSGQRIQGV